MTKSDALKRSIEFMKLRKKDIRSNYKLAINIKKSLPMSEDEIERRDYLVEYLGKEKDENF